MIRGTLAFADFVAFQAYLAQLAWPTVALGWIVNVFQRGAGALDRIEEILDTRPSVPAAGPPPCSAPAVGAAEIRLRGLTFSYRPGSGAAPALRDVSLDIPPGSRLALVGPVGSGKSTLVHLLAGVYPAPSGAIFVGETDLNEIPVEIHRRSVALVAQDPFLFSRTLRENLALARRRPPPRLDEHGARIRAALWDACRD